MSHPYHHAVSSTKLFGGDVRDYLFIHHWFDATKIVMADQRHRAFRHHEEAIESLVVSLGTGTVTNKDGAEVKVEDIGRQHIQEDFGGYVPTLADWVKTVAVRPWMQPAATGRGHAAALICARRYGGTDEDYMPLADWLYDGTTDDPRTFFLRGHAMACFWAEDVFGTTFTLSTGKPLPTRLAAEVIIANMFESRVIPSPQDWLRIIRRPTWQGQPKLMDA